VIEYVATIIAVLEAIALCFLFQELKETSKFLDRCNSDLARCLKDNETERKTYDFNLRGWQDRAHNAEAQLKESAHHMLRATRSNDVLRRKLNKLKKGKAK
jgi:FtsZ-binding cell division protein ZapB